MLLKTQRRHISPRTRQRCLAIRGFFKKALGSCSMTTQFFTKCGSTVFNTQLNKKVIDLEERLNALSIASIEKQSITKSTIEVSNNENNVITNEVETEVLYRTSDNRYKRCSSKPSQNHSELEDCDNHLNMSHSRISKRKTKHISGYNKSIESHYYSSEHPYMAQNYSVYYEENEPYFRKHRTKKHSSEHHNYLRHVDSEFLVEGNRSFRDNRKRSRRSNVTKQTSTLANCADTHEQNYIAQIIQKQYEPIIDVDEKKVAEISQFSLPVCRDHISLENTSLVPNDGKFTESLNYNNDDIEKNVNCAQKTKSKRRRKIKLNNAHDTELYDFIPVKEKSSPKSRRKFVEEQMMDNSFHKEVPPSPRTNRPRLNLTVKHYNDHDDYENMINYNNETSIDIVRDATSEGRSKDKAIIAKESAMNNSLINVNGSPGKCNTTLNEIKDTLHQFLKEVRNESSVNDGTPNVISQGNGPNITALPMLNSCYYPIVPICPVNYMQSAFVPSTSTCAACAHSNESEGTVAEHLIKQIHQSATPDHYDHFHQNQVNNNICNEKKIPISSRSAGSGRVFNCCDANVQIPTLKCISNSSVTIGSKIIPKERGCEIASSFSDFNELQANTQSIVAEGVLKCDINDTSLQNESNRWTKFFKSFGSDNKCKSITRDEESSSMQLRTAKNLHDSPRIVFDRNMLSHKSGDHHDMPCFYDSHYYNNFYLKEVQVKCVATQSERPKRYLFGLFSKRQPEKIMYPSKALDIQDTSKYSKRT